MTSATFLPVFAPLIVIGAAPVGLLLIATFHRGHRFPAAWTIGALLAAVLAAAWAGSRGMDRVTVFYTVFVFLASAVTAAFSYVYWREQPEPVEEYYVLLLCATLGAGVLVASTRFISFFLGLELLSVSLYAMIAYARGSESGTEAALKYLVLAAGSAAFLLFGMALVYAELGTMDIERIQLVSPVAPLVSIGIALMIVGIGFKLALAPFHLWTPDVYQGAPAPVTGFVASVSKAAVFVLLLRYFARMDVHASAAVYVAFGCIAIVSMTAGNLLALLQNNVKRILAYSSIAHLGYLLVAFLASGPLAATAAAFYLVSYCVTSLGTFGVIAVLSRGGREPMMLAEYRGMFWRRPWLASAFIVMLLSLAGIPLTAGFIGKFYLLAAGAESAQWLLLSALVLNSTLGLCYYLRVILALIAEPDEGAMAPAEMRVTGRVALAVTTCAIVFIGLYPAPLIRWIQPPRVCTGRPPMDGAVGRADTLHGTAGQPGR